MAQDGPRSRCGGRGGGLVGGLEQLDQVAGGVGEQDLAPAGSGDRLAAEGQARATESVDLGVEVVDDEVEAEVFGVEVDGGLNVVDEVADAGVLVGRVQEGGPWESGDGLVERVRDVEYLVASPHVRLTGDRLPGLPNPI